MLSDPVTTPTLKMSLLSFPPPTPQPRSRSSAALNILRILHNSEILLKSVIEYQRDSRVWIQKRMFPYFFCSSGQLLGSISQKRFYENPVRVSRNYFEGHTRWSGMSIKNLLSKIGWCIYFLLFIYGFSEWIARSQSRFWERGNPKHPPIPHPISKLPVTVEIDEVTRGNLVPRVLSYPPHGGRTRRREPWERGCIRGTGKRRKRVIRLLVPN